MAKATELEIWNWEKGDTENQNVKPRLEIQPE